EHEDLMRREFGAAPEAALSALAASLLPRQVPTRPAAPIPKSSRGWVVRNIDRSLAVMPLKNLSGDKANDYFGEGLADEMTNALGIAGLRSSARVALALSPRASWIRSRSASNWASPTCFVRSVQHDGGRLRIRMSLVSASDGVLVWGKKFDRDIRDVFAVQDEIAHSVAEGLQATLAGGAGMTLIRQETDDPEAHALYLQGLSPWNRRTAQTLHLAIDPFESA